MIAGLDVVVVDSAGQPAADCDVCGSEIEAEGGLTVRHGGRTMRFKCHGCLARPRADLKRILSGSGAAWCNGKHGASPASEWSGDRA